MEVKTLNKSLSPRLICATAIEYHYIGIIFRRPTLGDRKYRRDPRGLGEMNKVC
jgi:hypothetical protein